MIQSRLVNLKSVVQFELKQIQSKQALFIDEFKEDMKIHKVKFINEKKDRVMVLHIENLTKPLYRVFQKDLIFHLQAADLKLI